MTWRAQMPIKFSNLLQTNPQSTVYGIDISAYSNMENSSFLVERLRRKSLNIGTIKPRKAIESFSPELDNKNIMQLINKSKINRLLLEANFEKQSSNLSKNKKKKVYVIRRKDQKNKLEQKVRRQVSHRKYRYKDDQINNEGNEVNESEETESKKCQQIFKIKRKIPKFGIEDIVPKMASKRINQLCKRTAGLFMSTSSNHFYNSSFYMNSKMKQITDLRIDKKEQKTGLSPEVTNLTPSCQVQDGLRQKKKQRQKMYTTNINFSFTRSKTEEIEPNLLCGWEGLEEQQNQYID